MEYEVGYNRTDSVSGYGTFRTELQRAIKASGADISYISLPVMFDKLRRKTGPIRYRTTHHRFKRYLDERELPSAEERADNGPVTRPNVCRINPDIAERWAWQGAARRIGFTMWETDTLPSRGDFSWLPALRTAQTVIVPNEDNATLFRKAGLEDVRKVPLAIDATRYPYYDRTHRLPALRSRTRPFIFLMLGEITYRKGFDLALQSFGELFAKDPMVWLVIKTRGQSLFMQRRVPDSKQAWTGAPYAWYMDKAEAPNVMLLRGDWSHDRLLRLYQIADCFLWPSRGEGYGLPPREAASTGLPVLSPQHTGLEDADQWAYVLEHTKGGRAFFKVWGDCGHYQKPEQGHLTESMKWVYNHYGQALERGRSAAEYVRRRSWSDVASEVLEIAREGHNA